MKIVESKAHLNSRDKQELEKTQNFLEIELEITRTSLEETITQLQHVSPLETFFFFFFFFFF